LVKRVRRNPKGQSIARTRTHQAKPNSGKGRRLPRGPEQLGGRNVQGAAKQQLRRFRQGSILAISLTAFLLLAFSTSQTREDGVRDPATSVVEATGTIRELILGFYEMLPKLMIGLGLLLLAWLASKVTRLVSKQTMVRWEKTEAVNSLFSIAYYIIAIGATMSIIAGDARALVGSLGLVGLALSWALQTPIESFTGWLLNSLRSYYRVGDRIEVGEVFGDVYRVDILTTTVWEAGGPGKSVSGAQATGAMITFPNWEVLRSNIVNYSRDFPFVWDEVTISVANNSELSYCIGLIEKTAKLVIGDRMDEPARRYRELLARASLAFDVAEKPQVFLSLADAWTNCTLRYLVPARERRRWASKLILAITEESEKAEHAGRFILAYPRTEVFLAKSFEPVEKK